MWNQLSVPTSKLYSWDSNSTYIQEPPYFKSMTMDPPGPHGVPTACSTLGIALQQISSHLPEASTRIVQLPSILCRMGLTVAAVTIGEIGDRLWPYFDEGPRLCKVKWLTKNKN